MKQRHEQSLRVTEALWLFDDDRPCLGLLYGLDVLYLDPTISRQLLSLGLVYLGDEWKNKVPPLQVMGLELKGFVRDVQLNVLVKHFIAAVEGDYFAEQQISLPQYP